MKRSKKSTEALRTGFSILLSQALPRFLGYPVAVFIAWLTSLFRGTIAYRALMLNQWIISGKSKNERELKQTVRRILRNQGLAIYDFYHSLDRPDLIRELVKFTPKFQKLVDECKREEQPTMLLIPHLSGFNMGGLRLSLDGMRYLILTFPNPSRGYQWQNKIRNDRGMEVVPFTLEALGQARTRLQRGGTVLTGVDRPLEDSKYHPRFFGYPTNLPVAYVRLALKEKARVFVVGFMTLDDHTVLVDVSDAIVMESHADADREMEMNAEKVLSVAEEFIRKNPEHWMMFLPVWPDEIQNLKRQGRR